jgi:hypothetical protein
LSKTANFLINLKSNELVTNCNQQKLQSDDGKFHKTDCIYQLGIRNRELGIGSLNLSQISTRFVTDHGNKSLILLSQKEIIYVANIY